jgi:uncharacterized protein involved in exopolysaccharide biosynthesis
MRGVRSASVRTVDMTSAPPEGTVTLVQLFAAARYRWRWLLALVLVPAVLAVLLAITTPRRYEGAVVVLPRTQDRSALLGSLGQLGGLASLAGLGSAESGQRAEAIQMLQSQILARQFIEQNKLLPVLFPHDWDAEHQSWRRRARTMNEAVRQFDRGIRSVVEDRRTGLITMRITWLDRAQAAAWANDLVRLANDQLRRRAVQRAQGAIEYLQREASNATAVEIQQTLYRLMEEQYKTLLLAKVNEDYALSIIDPAVVADPNQYVSPHKVLNAFAGLMFGGVLALILVFIEAARMAQRQGRGGGHR